MPSLIDKDSVEQPRYLVPPEPKSTKTVEKSDKPDGNEETVLGDLSDLFVGDELVTPTEKSLELPTGDREARREIYSHIDEHFYEEGQFQEDTYRALKATVQEDSSLSLREFSHDYNFTTAGLVDQVEELDQAGFLNYEAGSADPNSIGEFAYTFLEEHENL